MPQILVTGGAGYIGSHMVRVLLDAGFGVVTLDNLCNGHRDAIAGGTFIHGDISDEILVQEVLVQQQISLVMHFASYIQVGESMSDPGKYYCNNVANTVRLLQTLCHCGIDKFVFSSSAAVYGDPKVVPIPESHRKMPLSPYGWSKWMVEQMLQDLDRARAFRSVSLRYFNAAGAHPDGLLGERHEPETHLIPLVLRAASGAAPHIKVFGDDYDTPDGTCIRDYVHVVDLCEAHLLAVNHLLAGGEGGAFNLGNGSGFSVREVVAAAERVTGCTIPVVAAPRRAGDPARLVADSSLARERLAWRPRLEQLETIIEHAWRWERKQRGDD